MSLSNTIEFMVRRFLRMGAVNTKKTYQVTTDWSFDQNSPLEKHPLTSILLR